MKTTIITAFAAVLLASVSTAALAQDQDQDHNGERHRGGAAERPQAAPQGAPGGGERPHTMGAPGGEWRGRGAPMPQQTQPQAAPQVQAAPAQPRVQTAPVTQPQGQRPDGGQRHDRGGAQPTPNVPAPAAQAPAQRQGFQGDRNGGGRDFRDNNDRRDDGRRDFGDRNDRRDAGRDRNDHRDWDPRRGSPPQRWERGRYPPVYASPQRFHGSSYRAPYGFFVRSWGFGDILPRGWYGDNYVIGDFYDYGLPYPPPGYEWVRVGADALLIDGYTGRVVQVVRYLFW